MARSGKQRESRAIVADCKGVREVRARASLPVWCTTNHSAVPRSLYEMTSDRMASSVARPPALRMTCASPSARPAYLAGSSRASMQVKMANLRAGGRASSDFAPKLAT